MLRVMLAVGVALCASAAEAAGHSYIPFTETMNAGGNQGLWLADITQLGNPPYQLTNQVLDGNTTITATVAVLDDWTLNTTTQQATGVTPQLVVWGSGGHLYKANLQKIAPVAQFSTGSYAQLCSLTALDERPYAAAKAYVQAVVEPVGSSNTCASGVGTQTWLIPASADNTVAPTLEPTNWSVLGAFTDPTDGSFVRWVVWSGNEVDAYKANFNGRTTLLVGPPTGPAPTVLARQGGDMVIAAASDNGTTHTDSVYHVSMTGSGAMGSVSYPDGSLCATVSTGAMLDNSTDIISFADTTAAGYGVFTALLTGSGGVSSVYSDNTGSACGAVAGDAVSGSYVGVNVENMSTGFEQVIGVNENGPANQTGTALAGSATVNAFVRYTINGHFWIVVDGFTSNPNVPSVLVADGNGTVQQDFSNSLMGDDIWHGFQVNGLGVERDIIYLFSPNATPCTGGTLTAEDPTAFTGTNISGVPSDTCSALAFGWEPASVGYVQEGTGSSPVEIDPVGGKLYQLLGTDQNGLFNNIATLPGYPFY
jgi:hypothetical protein